MNEQLTDLEKERAMLKSKAEAFDVLIEHLHAAGFDTSTSTHTDTASMLSSLALDGLEAACRKMAASISHSYEETHNLTARFQSETAPLLSALQQMTSGYTDMANSVSRLVNSDNTRVVSDKEIRRHLEDLHRISATLQCFERIGKNADIKGTSKISLDAESNAFMKGILKCVEASGNGNLISVGSRKTDGDGGNKA